MAGVLSLSLGAESGAAVGEGLSWGAVIPVQAFMRIPRTSNVSTRRAMNQLLSPEASVTGSRSSLLTIPRVL
jgi:hypothetical protein